MAFGDVGERTEPATSRKRQEARERGQVARSHDLTVALILLAACLSLHFFGLPGLERMGTLMARQLHAISSAPLGIQGVLQAVGACLLLAVQILFPVASLLFVAGLGANLLQVGFLVSGNQISPDPARLSPARGFGRIFSPRGLFRGAFGTLKVAVVGTVLCVTLWNELAGPHGRGSAILISGTAGEAAVYTVRLAVEMGLKAVAAILVLAILDYAYQRWQHEQDLRMTKSEVKEELRRMEGDPKMKERRRKVQQQLRFQRMMRDVPKASVVVTNPTHLAVAIRYQRETMAAPRVVAKGEGYIAQRIRERALEHGVPVVERKELARALYAAVEVGGEVPPELYRAVAELLAYVYRMAGLSPRPSIQPETAGAGVYGAGVDGAGASGGAERVS